MLSFLTLAVLARFAIATPSVSVSLAPGDSATSVVATVTNTGSEDVSLLKWGSILSDLSWTITQLGRLDEARIMQEKVLKHWDKTLGKEHPDTLRSMELLALTQRFSNTPNGTEGSEIFR